MKHSICYISKEVPTKDDPNFADLFDFVIKFNKDHNITGVLLYEDGFFLQVLEGETQLIKDLFQRIKRDQRHKDVLNILDRPIEKPIFKSYSTGFSILTEKKAIRDLNTYLSYNYPGNEYPQNIQFLLEPFLI